MVRNCHRMKLLVLSQEHFSIFYIVKYISLVAMDKTLLVFKLISLICSTFFVYALIFFLFYYLQEKLGPWGIEIGPSLSAAGHKPSKRGVI